MSKKKRQRKTAQGYKKSGYEHRTTKLTLITAIVLLIEAIIDLLIKIIEMLND